MACFGFLIFNVELRDGDPLFLASHPVHPMIRFERLQQLLATFPRLTVGLVGDLFLDRYLEIPHGVVEHSIETGWEAYQIRRVRNSPGALGTVMNNLAALGVGRIQPVTVIGDDGHGFQLARSRAALPAGTEHSIRCPERLTPTYTKPLRADGRGGWQELNRLDVRTREPLPSEVRAEVCRHLDEVLDSAAGLIVLDQISEENQGVIHDDVRAHLEQISRRQSDKLLYVDSRVFLGKFTFGTLKGNEAELRHVAGGAASAEAAAVSLARRTGRPVFCTQGERGVLVARPDGRTTHVPGYPVRGPIDIVGAGDSATAGMVLSLLAGADEIEAAAVGNLVASITVQQLGTTGTASPGQVLARWQETHP